MREDRRASSGRSASGSEWRMTQVYFDAGVDLAQQRRRDGRVGGPGPGLRRATAQRHVRPPTVSLVSSDGPGWPLGGVAPTATEIATLLARAHAGSREAVELVAVTQALA